MSLNFSEFALEVPDAVLAVYEWRPGRFFHRWGIFREYCTPLIPVEPKTSRFRPESPKWNEIMYIYIQLGTPTATARRHERAKHWIRMASYSALFSFQFLENFLRANVKICIWSICRKHRFLPSLVRWPPGIYLIDRRTWNTSSSDRTFKSNEICFRLFIYIYIYIYH